MHEGNRKAFRSKAVVRIDSCRDKRASCLLSHAGDGEECYSQKWQPFRGQNIQRKQAVDLFHKCEMDDREPGVLSAFQTICVRNRRKFTIL